MKSVGAEDDEKFRWAAVRVLPEVALAQVRSGDRGTANRTTKRALELFDRMRQASRDPTLLARIALAQSKADDREGSRASFERALRDADDAEDFRAAEVLATVAQAQREAGDEAAARKSLHEASGRIAGRDHNSQVDDLMTQAFLNLGDFDRALEIARHAHDDQGGLTLSPDVVRQLARAEIHSTGASRAPRLGHQGDVAGAPGLCTPRCGRGDPVQRFRYTDSLTLVRDHLDFLSIDERDWMLFRTAERILFKKLNA